KKSHSIIGIVGGVISSTAVTLSMSKESKGKKSVSPYAIATSIAMSIMFIRVLIEISIVNSSLLSSLLFPFIAMFLVGILSSFYFLKKKEDKKDAKEIKFKQP